MPKLSDYKPDTRLFALFVGPARSGKSSAAISLPTKTKLYDFDLNAISTAMGTPWIPPAQKNLIDVTSYPPHKSIEDFVADLNMLESNIAIAMGKKDRYPCQTLIIDSITSVSRVMMNEAYRTQSGREINIGKGKLTIRMAGPSDYNFKDEAIYQTFDFLRALPINVIVSAHIVPRYGKPLSMQFVETDGAKGKDPDKDFSEKIEIGEKLSITDKLGANLTSMFTEIYRFDKEEQSNGSNKYFVKFRGEMASTSHPGLPDGNVDITGKNFYEYWLSKVSGKEAVGK